MNVKIVFLISCLSFVELDSINGQNLAKDVQLLLEKNQQGGAGLRYLSHNKLGNHDIYYYNEQLEGIDVYNQIVFGVVNPTGQLIYSKNTEIKLPKLKQNTSIGVQEAVRKALYNNKISTREALNFVKQAGPQSIFVKEGAGEITAQLAWHKIKDQYRLYYYIDDLTELSGSYWRIWVDAETGSVVQRESMAKACFEEVNKTNDQRPKIFSSSSIQNLDFNYGAIGTYLVYPYPASSPAQTTQTVVSMPAEAISSPFGWHDTNGLDGSEYTITQGNNATVFLDRNADFVKDGPEPNGGLDLVFNQPINLNLEPESYTAGSSVQLFYQLNTLHDVLYNHGFDELANFQQLNYGGQGLGGDAVVGLVQYGAARNERDNADFIPSTDGKVAYLRPYVWTRNNSQLLSITSPTSLVGAVDSRGASFGPQITSTPITGKVVYYQDGSSRPGLGCQDAINAPELKGNVALIDRGICFFHEKILNAQKAGAIACIICNYENELVSMGEVEDLEIPNIPAIAIKYNNCQTIKAALKNGVSVKIQLPTASGANNLDATLDNGVIAHEYYHGVSERLVGGPQTIGCLGNVFYDTDRVADDGEQMGEGWSDFFALYMTTSNKDSAQDSRGIATYLLRESADGRGVRLHPYSTDLSKSPYKYEDIWTATIPHGVGAVWNAVLWDIYWGMVDIYGLDNNYTTGQGGNNKALKLITEALKLTPCSPGFIDGRDAILATDKLLFDGRHECMLWKVFAKRGLGFGASQGNSSIIADGKTSFLEHPQCSEQIEFIKTVSPDVQPGDDILVKLLVKNYSPELLKQLVITDSIPLGLTVAPNSANVNIQVQDNYWTYTHPEVAPGDSLMITYALQTNNQKSSNLLFFDNLEAGDRNWDFINLDGIDIWSLEKKDALSGQYAWFVENKEAFNDQVLQNNTPWKVSGTFPVLKFYHKIASQWGVDGGVLEISTNHGGTWLDAGPLMFRNNYQGPIAPATFLESGRRAFYGEMEAYEPVYVDLRPYLNQSINWRWRFASNNSVKYSGWLLDDIQIMDALAYNSTACMTIKGQQPVCVKATGEGTIVEGEVTTSVKPQLEDAYLKLTPNPNQGSTQLSLNLEGNYTVVIHNLYGQQVSSFNWSNRGAALPISTIDWSPGMYIITLQSNQGSVSVKMIIN